MRKRSIIKGGMYVGAFFLGYASGQFSGDQITRTPATAITQPFVAATCPAPDTSSSTIADSLTQDAAVEKRTKPEAIFAAPENRKTESEQNAVANTTNRQAAAEIAISDFDNPDEQIKSVLTANMDEANQDNEQLKENVDPLEPLFNLPEDKQLDYVKTLVESQEDSAIVALNDLILTDDQTIQTAAIDGLLSLLEMRTGHFDTIANNLEQNAVFFTEEQMLRYQKATQIAARH